LYRLPLAGEKTAHHRPANTSTTMTSTKMGYDMIEFLRANFEYRDGAIYRTSCQGGEATGKRAGWLTTCNGKPYWKVSVMRKTMYLHHVVFLLHHGFLPKYIDHKDGNSTNNQIENLREATQSQNIANSKLSASNTSGYKGVVWRKDTKKWQAQLTVDGKNISLGSHTTKEKAHEAYKSASSKYFEEFSRA